LLVRGCMPKKARFTIELPSITSSFMVSLPLPQGMTLHSNIIEYCSKFCGEKQRGFVFPPRWYAPPAGSPFFQERGKRKPGERVSFPWTPFSGCANPVFLRRYLGNGAPPAGARERSCITQHKPVKQLFYLRNIIDIDYLS